MSTATLALRCPLCGSDAICTPGNTVTYHGGSVVPTVEWSCYECDHRGDAEDFGDGE
jgi:C4-type Zn-finger protein